jgi:hypothetical protein
MNEEVESLLEDIEAVEKIIKHLRSGADYMVLGRDAEGWFFMYKAKIPELLALLPEMAKELHDNQ